MNKLKNILKNKTILTIILSGFVYLIVLLLWNQFVYLDKQIQYSLLSFKNHSISFDVSKDIVVVEIDNKTHKKLGFPFARDNYAKVIDKLKKGWASVIWVDVIFTDQSNNKKADELFMKSIKNAWNIILWNWLWKNNSFYLPFNNFLQYSAWAWFYNPIVDQKTNTIYSVYPSLKLKINNDKNNIKSINYFPIEILKYYFKSDKIEKNNTWFWLTDYLKVPFSKFWNNQMLINFLPRYKFTKTSFLNILEWNIPFNIKDKIVLIWATSDWLKDIFNTPNWRDFWIYVHANTINTILSGKFLVYFNPLLEKLLIFLLIVLAISFNFSKNNKLLLISNISIIFIFFSIPVLLIFLSNIMFNYPSSLILAFIFSFTLSNIVKYLIENKDKKKVLKALWEYISKDVAEEILNWEWVIDLKWQKKKISIFFSDIEWFTSISEKLEPEELVMFLREYLWAMSNIIMDEKWLIDKYEWDAIMALWWVFWYKETSSYDNCISALKQQTLLKSLNKDWKVRFWEELKIRMWLNTWEAIVWNIWAEWRKMEFTALWDSVNLASRLEEVNKKYWTYICVSENIYNEQKDNFEFRFLDKIKVKWKNIPVSIYELLWKKWSLSDLKYDIVNWFEIAMNFYFKQEFKKASEIFDKLSKLWDKPSLTYLKRCLQFEIVSPDKDWDWVWVMKTK